MRRILTMLLAATALTACGSTSESSALTWRQSDEPSGLDAAGLVWADRDSGAVTLSDGSTLDAGRSISSFTLAGDGAYVVDASDDSLVEVTADGARATGAHVDERVKASASGRYLAFIDPTAGPLFEGSVHVLTAVVVDLKTGEELFRSTQGMGDPDTDDLTDLYEDTDHGVLGVTDETAWFRVPTGDVLAIDLSAGTAKSQPGTDTSDAQSPWVVPQLSPPTAGGRATSDGSYGIYHVSTKDPAQSTDPAVTFPRDEVEKPDGTRLAPRPDAQNWSFEQWIDDTTVVGFANTGLDDPSRVENAMPSSVLTCSVPDDDCTVIPDSDGAILPEPSLS